MSRSKNKPKKSGGGGFGVLIFSPIFLVVGIWMAIAEPGKLWTAIACAALGLVGTAITVVLLIEARTSGKPGAAARRPANDDSRSGYLFVAALAAVFAIAAVALALAGFKEESSRDPGPLLVVVGIVGALVFGGFAVLAVVKGRRERS